MKKIIALIFAVCIIIAISVAADRQPETKAPETMPPVTEPPEMFLPSEEEQSTEPSEETVEIPAGELYLTVSKIVFSTVGETENIYEGTVPLDQITWTSEDETVIRAENGVLTAVGVGNTRVTASCEGQEISCEAGCLAETREDLAALGMDVLREPKRLAPQVPDDVISYYEDAVMVGDSITYGFLKYEARNGRLGSPRCLCRGSLGIDNLLHHQLELLYGGEPTHLEDVIRQVSPGKMFVLLGTNDVMVRPADLVLEQLEELLDRVKEKSPEVEIYLQSVFPIVSQNIHSNSTNERISAYNEELRKFAEEHGYHYVPVAPYLQDHIPGFARIYEQDTYHPSYEGVCAWVDALRSYAYIERLKGE